MLTKVIVETHAHFSKMPPKRPRLPVQDLIFCCFNKSYLRVGFKC